MNQPNLIALVAVIVGIIAAVLLPVAPGGWVFGAGLFLALILWSCRRLRPQVTGWLVVGSLICLAGLTFSYQRENFRDRLRYNHSFTGKTLVVEGKLVSRPEKTDWGVRFELALKKYRNHPRGKITVYYSGKVPEAWLGRVVRIKGRFGKIPENPRGLPDFYERCQLTGRIIADQAPLLVRARVSILAWDIWANQLRLRLSRVARDNLSPLNRQVLQGMVFGEDLSETGTAGQVLEDFRRTGTIHLLSVSGLHVGFIVAGLTALLGWCGMRSAARLPFIILGVWFYIMMTGLEAPVLRSGCMLMLYLIAGQLKTKDDPLNRLGLAAVILLLIRPANLFEIGFQLSFTATAGVVGLYPVLREYFPVKHPYLKPVWETLLVSIAAQLMVLPLLVWYFYQISWIAPLANLVFTIPAFFIVVGGLAGELLGLIFPQAASIILGGIDGIINLCLQLMRFCSAPAWAVSWMPRWPWPWLVSYYLGLVLLVSKLRPNLITGRRHLNPIRWGLAGLLVLTVAIWIGVYLKAQGGYLEAVFIDVGQGDAIFLKTPDNYRVLVDGGDEGRGRNRVLPYLQQQGVFRLDAVFGTHGHRDHLGGLDEVLAKVPAGILYAPEIRNQVTRKFMVKIKGLKLSRRRVLSGMRLRWGKHVWARVWQLTDAVGENDLSTVLLVGYGKYRLLLTGDLGCQGEKILADKYPQLLQATVLKAGHHGSDYSSTWNLISQVKPRIAIISAGTVNRYGHPGKTALNRLRSLGADIYRTDWHGTIRVRIYPDRILVIPEKVVQDEAG